MAERLAASGAAVAVTARSVHSHPQKLPGTLEETAQRIGSRGGRVNVSSASAELPQGPPYAEWERQAGMHLYAASKSALNRLTAGLAAELHADGIAVNALAPVAAVMTPGLEALGATRGSSPP